MTVCGVPVDDKTLDLIRISEFAWRSRDKVEMLRVTEDQVTKAQAATIELSEQDVVRWLFTVAQGAFEGSYDEAPAWYREQYAQ